MLGVTRKLNGANTGLSTDLPVSTLCQEKPS